MKLGVFLPNGRNGFILSKAAPNYMPTFTHLRDITLEAERWGLDFALSMIKFRGFGGETGFWDGCLESLNLTAALAAVTSRIELIASIGLLSIHPAVAARMMATLDDVSGGRCGLNIVTGWAKPEYDQMGLWPGDNYFDRRYDYAGHYVDILQQLWRTGRATHHSEFFDLTDCQCLPMPQREIPIVCAGQSPRGVQFTARHGHHNFVMADQTSLKRITDGLAEESGKLGRKVGTYALYVVVMEATDAAAEARAAEIVAGADGQAIANMIGSAVLDTNKGGSSDRLREMLAAPVRDGNMAFLSFPAIIGSPASVAQQVNMLAAETGVDGMLLTFPDFVPGVRMFGEQVKPLLDQPRKPSTAAA